MLVAFLIVGSAILVSCSRKNAEDAGPPPENLVTQQSDTLVRFLSENGVKSYRFYTPLLEQYDYAPEPYIEFRRGIDIMTFDTLGATRSTLVADYAIHFIRQKLWEAKGNVKATNDAGDRLETQQLFWNQATGKIYSNIDTKLTRGEDVIYGVGFESDEQFKKWEFRKPRGRLTVDMEPTRDTMANGSEISPPGPQPPQPPTPSTSPVQSVAPAIPATSQKQAETVVPHDPMLSLKRRGFIPNRNRP